MVLTLQKGQFDILFSGYLLVILLAGLAFIAFLLPKAFCLGVLWHPEEAGTGTGAPVFRALVEAAAAYAATRR